MMRSCPQCRTTFSPLHNARYCSEECRQAAHTKKCEQCGETFPVPSGRDPEQRKYCSRRCSNAATNAETAKARRARPRIEVRCALADSGLCPRPDELIPTVAGRPIRYHTPECVQTRYRLGGGRKGKRTGTVIFCQHCGREIGYRPPGLLHQKYCAECARIAPYRLKGGRSAKTGTEQPCTVCQQSVYVPPSKAKKRSHIFCSLEHYHEWQRGSATVHVRCIACDSVRTFLSSRIPPAVDQETMTWTCMACRPRITGVRTYTCAQCQKPFTRRVKLASSAEGEHFCTTACRRRYYRELRKRASPCRHCGGVIERRGRDNVYCSWACRNAHKVGRPNKHYRPSKAELKVLTAWERGARGSLRTLAEKSGASVNTVRKLMAAGKLVEPALSA